MRPQWHGQSVSLPMEAIQQNCPKHPVPKISHRLSDRRSTQAPRCGRGKPQISETNATSHATMHSLNFIGEEQHAVPCQGHRQDVWRHTRGRGKFPKNLHTPPSGRSSNEPLGPRDPRLDAKLCCPQADPLHWPSPCVNSCHNLAGRRGSPDTSPGRTAVPCVESSQHQGPHAKTPLVFHRGCHAPRSTGRSRHLPGAFPCLVPALQSVVHAWLLSARSCHGMLRRAPCVSVAWLEPGAFFPIWTRHLCSLPAQYMQSVTRGQAGTASAIWEQHHTGRVQSMAPPASHFGSRRGDLRGPQRRPSSLEPQYDLQRCCQLPTNHFLQSGPAQLTRKSDQLVSR